MITMLANIGGNEAYHVDYNTDGSVQLWANDGSKVNVTRTELELLLQGSRAVTS